MKITQLETIRLGEFPNILWVRLHTDEGLVGLGETFMGAEAVEAYLHEWAAAKLIGTDPLQIEARNRDITGYLGWRGSGVETRGNSAIDIALWDIFGKAANMPVHTALGGKSRDSIRIYNTCAGYQYIRSATNQTSSNWGLANNNGPYEDLQGFLHHADELAESLLGEGITAMKIWPFDPAAEKSHGQYISNTDLDLALEPFRKIRNAVGNKMDIMVEFHSLWRLPMAQKIARALKEFNTFWHEDAIRMDSLDLLKQYAKDCDALICASETLSYKWGFKDYLQTGVAGVGCIHPFEPARAQRANPGKCAGVLQRLVQRAGDRTADRGERNDPPERQTWPGTGAAAGPAQAGGCGSALVQTHLNNGVEIPSCHTEAGKGKHELLRHISLQLI